MEQYGAEAVILMDSAGAYFPEDVRERIGHLVDGLCDPRRLPRATTTWHGGRQLASPR